MLQLQRHSDILRLLRERGEVTVKELCAELYISSATARRDLAELEKSGLLKRSFGGAVINESYPDQQPLVIRSAEHVAEKKKIAQKAVSLIKEGETVFIDASSTTYFMAHYLKNVPNVTVITNNPYLNVVLSELKIRNFCTGGEMLNFSVALVGSDAERYVKNVYARSFFFSARGICNGEISESSKAERDIKVAMLERSDNRYFLCDSSKFDTRFPFKVADLSENTFLIDET